VAGVSVARQFLEREYRGPYCGWVRPVKFVGPLLWRQRTKPLEFVTSVRVSLRAQGFVAEDGGVLEEWTVMILPCGESPCGPWRLP
jgi:hypothetical protein